ncbi:pyridoxal phosphate-dependent aminotransferase [Acidiluteibacter ferrifornacis]|uniref:Aminotransferase n=1 Tax=Acidiluteibacter ferrifornacis TaxID=2692424 RepID=A0A6N9NJF3_9FLAO|nr:pyridoxal phosphate-dependent aminotransferase [Acidiluteibacter ferrifornacis]NBG66816.1 aminotransferase class I/II-fold pyridoxal phosphate-dependent enzyme [Acidiluteibacter ferrifornacis]
MSQVADRINHLSESQTLAMARRSRELQQAGIDIISLSLGEPDFDTPDFVKKAANEAIANNFTHYTPVNGYLEVRQAVSEKFKRDNNLNYSPDEIVISTGAKQSITNVMLSIVNPGDEVIVPAPYWVSYIEIIKMAEGIPVIIEAGIEQDFKVSAEQIEAAITPKTKMMIFSTPCNPTGSVYGQQELKEIAEVMKRNPNFLVISDEIYEHINFVNQHQSLAQFSEIKDQVITINGVSKGFAMTGWRIGYIGAPKWIADACTKIQGQVTSGTCSIAQKAAQAALLASPVVLKEMQTAFRNRRDLVLELLQKIPGVKTNTPEGAFYVFPDVSSFFGKSFNGRSIENANDLSLFLLDEAKVALVTGEAFGNPNCIRISYAASESVLTEALKRIQTALAKI